MMFTIVCSRQTDRIINNWRSVIAVAHYRRLCGNWWFPWYREPTARHPLYHVDIGDEWL